MLEVLIRKERFNDIIQREFINKDLIDFEEIIELLETKLHEVELLKEQIEDKENQEERITDHYDYYGVSEKDFI